MKKILLFFVMFFPFLSLFAGWGADLCEDVTCSGHGECQEDGEDEWCLCDEGYIADGMNCILGCNGVTCSGHGVCSVVSGAEVCSCEAGFHASGLNCILNEASTVDTLAVLNETDCYNTGNCHYRLIFATGAYDFTPALSSLYDIIVNVLDSGNVWHNYRKTVAQCVTEGVCDNVDAQYIDFWFQHNVNGNQYVTVELLGNGDDAYDDMFHDVLIDYCYGVNCGTGGTCDGTSGYPVCSCDEGYVLRGSICEEGWFEDENLAAAVVELLQYDGYEVETETDIDPEMLEGITHLTLRGKNISSLAGIELFSSLAVLDVSENMISDLSPLSNCEELVILNMSGNPANDLSPLSALPLVSLDISYSGVYNINPLVSIETLSELILADMENGRHGIIRPENSTVSEWLLNQEFPGCNKFYFYGSSNSNTFGVGFIETGSNCQAHGSCVNGMCVCDEGYSYSLINNSCYIPNICDAESHPNPATGICEDNKQYIHCGDEPGKKFSYSYLEWNGSEYAFPDGYTNTEPCKIGDGTCDGDNNRSICRWSCETDYTAVGNVCVPRAVREIPDSAYNQLILPHISRQDVSLEPVPGVPSFAPVLNAGFYYSAKKNLEYGWYFDLPRVELNLNERGYTLTSYEWDQKTVYVYMPWGKEEYSIEAEKKCLDSDNYPVDCETSPDIDRLEITYYPAPGQNLFSYVVLETTGEAYGFNFGVDRNDWWKITRYGEDGSVTEFSRNYNKNGNEEVVPRPNFFSFMDYIPISKHVTRDKKETSFSYEWGLVKRMYTQSVHFYYIIRSATIVDPLKRVIKIESSDPELSDSETQEYGLMGRPGSYFLVYTPLEGDVEISVGRADHDGEVIESTLKKVVKYSNIDGFSMDAKIYKDEHLYRKDRYSIDDSNKNLFVLDSYAVISVNSFPLDSSVGRMTWEFTKENDNPDGYVERKLVNSDDPNDPEYIVKTVKGKFYQPRQKIYPSEYSLSYSPLKTETIYSHEKSGSSDKKRIVEDYFTEWLQPAKRWICERDYDDDEKNCDGISNTVSESIKYNVSGSPIYFKNADGQVTVNIYNTTDEVSPGNYIVHFLSDPWNYSNAVNLNVNLPTPDFIRADNLHKTGTLACSSVYSLDTGSVGGMMLNYVAYGITPNSDFCSSSENKRVTNYVWKEEASGKPYDLKTVTYPDGKEQEFTYDYEMTADGVGKIRGETVTGSNNQNTLQTCYKYDNNYQLIEQGIGLPGPDCSKKKGFSFSGEGGLLMTHDYSFDENNTPVLANDYIYDYLGRKLVERNSAGVSTVYVYDSLDRVVFTFFGCNVDNFAFENRVYTPYSFDGDASAGVTGSGVTFDYNRGEFPYARYINLNSCEYYRKYTYDTMSNLTETYFFEYWGVNANNQVVQLDSPKIIKQTTEYDMLGRAVKSCQFDGSTANPTDDDKRCIETEHDIFGNIVKKKENGEVRTITYDLRNRPLTVTVDGLQTEQYFYHNETCDTYCGYDEIANKYGTTNTLKTYKDRWGRAAKSVDPFGNNVEPHYNSTTWLTDYSKTYNGTTLTSFDAYEYDDLGRVSTIKKVLFDPASNTSNAAATSINSIAAKEMVIEKSYSYDLDTGSVVAIEDSLGRESVNTYDHLNRVVEVKNYDADNLLVSSERTAYDASGRISAVQNWTSAKTTVTEYDYDRMGRVTATCVSTANVPETQDCLANSCTFTDTKCSYQLYNTGGQVVWSADTERGEITNLLPFLNMSLFVGNETVYSYNAFGEVVKTARRMTANGSGGGYKETQLYNSDGWITTNYTYDIFGRNTEKADDNGSKTHYTYTANNLPATETYCGSSDSNCASPREVTYTYNTLRDLVSETYEQDNVSLTVNYGRDNYGRISQKYTGTTATDVYQTFTYNNRNLLETAKSVDPTNTTSTLSEVTRTYDSFGNIKSETFDSGTVSSAISWNSSTKVMTETTTLPTGKNIVETAFSGLPEALEYDGTKLLQYNYGTGNVLTSIRKNFDSNNNHAAELSYTYNDWRKVSRRKEDFTSLNAPAVADYEYTYSKGLHLIGKQENEENRRTAYQYDSYYRLRRVDYDCAYSSSDPTCMENRNNVFKCNSSESGCEDFQLDGVHNIRSSYENQTNFAWTVDGFNRLTQKSDGSNTVKYTYDSNNNMTGEDLDGDQNADIVYTYDKLNRLTSVANSDYLVEYSYDPFNRRTEKTVYYTENSSTFERTHKYAYDGWDIISEEIKTVRTSDTPATTVTWQLRRYVDHGTDNHIIMDTVSCSDDGNGNCSPNESTLQRIWFHKDERGNIIAISDGNGTIYERYRYRVYGEHEVLNADFTTKSTAAISPFLWGGSLYEPETNLYWMRNRYYHIDMHRFINQDPIGIWGDANNLGNGFAYVAGMVIEASDPSGLWKAIENANLEDLLQKTKDLEELVDEAFREATNSQEEAPISSGKRDRDDSSAHNWGGAVDVNFKNVANPTQIKLNFARILRDKLNERYGNGFVGSKRFQIIVEDKSNPPKKYPPIIGENGIQKGPSEGAIGHVVHVGWRTAEKPSNNDVEQKNKKEMKKDKKKQQNEVEKNNLNNPSTLPGPAEGQVRTVYPNGAVVDCEFGSCWCVSGNCAGAMNGSMPSNPDEDLDLVQQYLAFNILKKMLRLADYSEDKPFEKYESDGYIMFVRNPFYRQKDPLKMIIKEGHNGRGFMFVRNPFAAPPEYNPFASTADFWFNSDFNRGNIDPYWY
ncbi:hypothetical protein J6W78_07960 [bacterium]|nr:hypothetical protein [bacterium]